MNKVSNVFLIMMVALHCVAQENKTDFEKSVDLESLFKKEILGQNIVGAAAGYSINGQTIWQTTGGFADRENKKPFQKETKVRMASIAKSMTAIALMQLVEKGLIDLDLPIQTYLSDYPRHPTTQITVRHLLSHTSGIKGYKNGKEAETKINYPTLSEAVKIFIDRELLFEPGSAYSYTSYGYTLLGLIIEKVSGLTFEKYMQEHIFDVAEMSNTGVDVYGVEEEHSSKLYNRRKPRKVKPGKENNLSNRVPGGGFYTTIEDMLKFGNAVIDNVFIKKESLDLMRKRHSINTETRYGLGWFLYSPEPNEGKIIGHSGGQTGCSSQMSIYPEKQIVSVVLANTSRTEVIGFTVELLKIATSQ